MQWGHLLRFLSHQMSYMSFNEHHQRIIISSLLLYSRFLTSFLCVSIPLCPQLPVWVEHIHHNLPNHVAFEFFSSILLVYSALNNFMQKAIVSQNMANPSMFPLLHHILNTTMGIVNWLNYHFLSTAVQAYHIIPKIAYQITMDVHKGFYPPKSYICTSEFLLMKIQFDHKLTFQHIDLPGTER